LAKIITYRRNVNARKKNKGGKDQGNITVQRGVEVCIRLARSVI
jgi:hypothetical protein